MMHFTSMKLHTLRLYFMGILATALVLPMAAFAEGEKPAKKKLILIAGKPSHGPGDHEFNAGCR